MSMAHICGYHSISKRRPCSVDNVVLELEMFPPNSKHRLSFLNVLESWKTGGGNETSVTQPKVKLIHRAHLGPIHKFNTKYRKAQMLHPGLGQHAQSIVSTSLPWGHLK